MRGSRRRTLRRGRIHVGLEQEKRSAQRVLELEEQVGNQKMEKEYVIDR